MNAKDNYSWIDTGSREEDVSNIESKCNGQILETFWYGTLPAKNCD